MRQSWLVVAAFVLAAGQTAAQDDLPSFEVVSIKTNRYGRDQLIRAYDVLAIHGVERPKEN